MKTLELTVTRVGNSRGVRLPADVLRRYRIGGKVIMEQRSDEIALRPIRGGKLRGRKPRRLWPPRTKTGRIGTAPSLMASVNFNRFDIH
jgi:hypothetical protein